MTHDASRPEFWRSLWQGHKRDRRRRGHRTEAEYMTEYQRDWLGEVYTPKPTWWERSLAPLAKGSMVAALMMATGLFALAIGYGLR